MRPLYPHIVTMSWQGFPHGNAVRVTDHETLLSQLATGSADGSPTILFVHSALLDRHAWYRTMHEVADRLSAAGQSFTLATYDLRGHGAAAGESIVSIDQLAHDLLAICSTLTTGPVHVVGLSLGGAVAQAAALDSPERIASLALLGTSARFPRTAMYERAARGKVNGVASQVDDTLARWVSDPVADDEVNRYIRHALAQTTPERWGQTWEALGRFDVVDLLPSLRCPVLALAGTRDVASPPEALELIAKSVMDGTVEYLDAAHLSALERPSEVAVHITDHLLRVSSRG
jgi:3-oxoadipate enol-lactonase